MFKFKVFLKPILILSVLLTAGIVFANNQNIDVRDLRDYGSLDSGFIHKLANCNECWPTGVSFHLYGTDRNKDFTHYDAVYWTVIKQKTNTQYHLASVISYQSKIFIREHKLNFKANKIEVLDIQDTDAKSGAWSVTIKGLQREFYLSHSVSSFEIVIPMVVGGFDITETKLKLPPGRTHMSKVDSSGQATNWYSRTDPAYYQGYPFIKLLNSKGVYTAYGIHAPMNPGAMKRGFWSTGCIRIRIMDLYPMYYLVDSLGGKKISVISETGSFSEPTQHPYPLMDNKYKRVNKKKPMGDDGLSNMEIVEAAPPLGRLQIN